MNKETSVYLDLLRFLAALVVFLSHISGSRFMGGFLWQFSSYGTEAVDIFFVLSGFVIAYVVDCREHTAGDYMISRAARIYSVALPALVVTLCLDTIGRAAHPGLYTEQWGYVWDDRNWQFISGLLFINQLWFNNTVPGSDLPYWSLGFETWYYVIFGLIIFMPQKWKGISVGAMLLLVGPRIAAMLPIWLLGVACYYSCKTAPLSRVSGAICCLAGSATRCSPGIMADGLWLWLPETQ
jgi:peptidoglycan/LPS O-acetylase OafA/YrhL